MKLSLKRVLEIAWTEYIKVRENCFDKGGSYE